MAPGAPAAFFDVDNTIMRGSSAFYFFRGMAQRDLVTKRDMADATWKQFKFVMSGSEDLDDVAQATEAGLAFIAGKREVDVRQVAEEVYDELMVDRFWPGTVALAQDHLSRGHRVWLVTATPQEIADVIARRMGLSGAIGTQAAVDEQGQYTGKLAAPPMHGTAKAAAVVDLAGREEIDLERSWAYSDSANDIPMLSLVGHPVAVNPDTRLRAHAMVSGWPVRDYRARSSRAVKVGIPSASAALLGLAAGIVIGVAGSKRD